MPRKRGFRFLIKNVCVLILFTVPGAVSGPPPPCLLWPPGGGQRIPAGQAGMAHSTHPSERFIFRLVYVIYSVSTPRWLGRKANLFQLFPLFKKKKTLSSPGLFRYFSLVVLEGFPLCPDLSHGERSRIRTRSIPQPQQSDALRMSHHISTSHDISVID